MAEWLTSMCLRLRALLRRRQQELEFHDELAFHLAMREEQLRAAGTAAADKLAQRRFGSVARIREDLRDVWAFAPTVSALMRDFHYAARSLRKSPGFVSVVVFTLGLGIGANTAFFSLVNAVLIRPLGYADADRLMLVEEGFPQARIDRLPFSALDFDDFSHYTGSFEAVAAYRNVPFELSGDGVPERIAAAKVSPELFGLLGTGPVFGRTFVAAEDRPGVRVVMLSWGLWQRRYGGDRSIAGRIIQLDRQPYAVIGVMPKGFVFPRQGPQFNGEPADVWVPIAFTDRERLERGSLHANSVIARLKPDVSFRSVKAELPVLAERIGANYPAAVRNAGFSPQLFAEPLHDAISGRFEAPLLLLLSAVGLVLLVACANVANLVLSRVTARTREFVVRTALGARRAQLIQLLLCEALLLSAAGGIAGITIASWAIRAVPAVLSQAIPGVQDVSIDFRVLVATGALCLGTAVICTLVPLSQMERPNAAESLRGDPARTTSTSGALRLQRGFVILTVALACVLLVATGLFARSFATLIATDIGFRPTRVLTASMTLPRTFYTTAASVHAFHESLSRSLSALPGVRRVATATDLPLSAYDVRAFTPEGAHTSTGPQPATNLTWVHGRYFETLGMTLSRGRFFTTDEDTHPRGVVIINERLAALAWPGRDPIGRRLKWGGAEGPAPWLTVVGVIRNVADGPIGTEPGVHAYEPFRQIPDFFLNGAANQFGRDLKAAVLVDREPRALAPRVRQEISQLDPALAIQSIETMDEQVSRVVAPQRFSALLVGGFSAMALLLSSVGLYGLLAFTTALRQKEIAVRMALGAERRAVISMVIGQGVRLVAAGIFIGSLGSLAVARLISSLLYQTSPYDLRTFATVPVVLIPTALLGCFICAWRAARVNAIAALRAE